MRYQIVAVGKLKRGFYRVGCDYFAKRLKRYGVVEVVEVKASAGGPAAQQSEGEALLARSSGYLIAVDERGKQFRSGDLAKRMGELELSGHGRVSLLIGGPDGHAAVVKDAAQESWSLSKLTLAHELARLVLLEQLYRAEAIRANHPYHRG